ncbi:MAG TPA: hypothetical protein VFJ30_01485 [Phycisphaerae bacterium]|nr:hypothetical protein [Phycisphaerae bacterium]
MPLLFATTFRWWFAGLDTPQAGFQPGFSIRGFSRMPSRARNREDAPIVKRTALFPRCLKALIEKPR